MNALTAYRVHYSDGSTIPTSMAAHVTLDMARRYFIGQRFELIEGRPTVTAVRVEPIREPKGSAS